MIRITYTKSYDQNIKKLKKNSKEHDNLNKIIELIENSESFEELKNNPIAIVLYNFERLKHKLNKYYSFNLNKNGGLIRLIIYPSEENVDLVYISLKHYKDFDESKVKYYDE